MKSKKYPKGKIPVKAFTVNCDVPDCPHDAEYKLEITVCKHHKKQIDYMFMKKKPELVE